ncbi:ABC transporter ATP-binding protein [Telmatospirillum siberiense]|uniref:ABC transporter ATP-binding protein n=1 Tax=Telmatospirillum siberiense TaxID=382514 RepID=A0A2N3PUT1_9PROT|nr:ABC transporter ATP-binding protein [Telmatospirillum siberiense]PKU24162.1 ABC transporter ATP-binding protein [Telmatospirillum siberiense]
MSELLRLDNVTAGYGDGIVLDDVSFSLKEGDSLALLGRNGVGKTTLLVTLMGFTRLHKGRLAWRGRDLGGMPTFRRAHAGLGWVPQERLMFPSLSVEEHLTSVARPGRWTLKTVYRVFPRLRERRANLGNQLSGGEQQMLAIGRALMVNPSLLLLDEPMEGLAPIIVQELVSVIRDLTTGTGMAVIVVEQHARLALALTRQAIILDRGRIVHRSDSASLAHDDRLLQRLVAVA